MSEKHKPGFLLMPSPSFERCRALAKAKGKKNPYQNNKGRKIKSDLVAVTDHPG